MVNLGGLDEEASAFMVDAQATVSLDDSCAYFPPRVILHHPVLIRVGLAPDRCCAVSPPDYLGGEGADCWPSWLGWSVQWIGHVTSFDH